MEKNSSAHSEQGSAAQNAGFTATGKKKIKRDEIKSSECVIFCSSCLMYLPASVEFFQRNRLHRAVKVCKCKFCISEDNKIRAASDVSYKEKSKKRAKDWYEKNKQLTIDRASDWKKKNKDKVFDSNKRYMQKDESKKLRREAQSRRYKNDPNKYRAMAKSRDGRVKMSMPSWETNKNVLEYYKAAGILGLEVDHIVPIQSDIVCGLHCVDNFQMLTREENASKSNRFWPDMP